MTVKTAEKPHRRFKKENGWCQWCGNKYKCSKPHHFFLRKKRRQKMKYELYEKQMKEYFEKIEKLYFPNRIKISKEFE